MEFLLGLSDDQVKRRIRRQKRLRWLFGVLGITFVGVQVVAFSMPGPRQAVVQVFQPTTPTLAPTRALPTPTQTPSPTPLPPSPTPTPTQTPTLVPTETPFPVTVAPATGSTDPGNPTVTLLLDATSQVVSEQTALLSGSGQAGDVVSILYHYSVIAETEVNPEGQWQVEIPTEPLARGENMLSVTSSTSSHSLSLDLTFAPWWLESPARLQGALGEGYACAPTVLGMALDYYAAQDPSYAAPPTVEIVEALKNKGFVDGYGADAAMLVNLAIEYGYSHSFFYRNWTQAHLRKMLDESTPVIVNVRSDLSTDGYGHSVLVIGMSPDGQRVMVIDPAQGMVEVPWTTLDASWGSFGPPYRHGLVVKP